MSARALPLTSLLSIVPYFHARGAVPISDAAADLGLTEKQLRHALWQLWSCGLPGYGPGELIDLGFSTESLDDADLVEVTFTAGIDRPVRLTAAEAVTLETGLAVFLDQPGAVDQQALVELMAVLRSAAGDHHDRPEPPPVAEAEHDAELVRRAVREGKALRFSYFSASSDTLSMRVVDPARVYVASGHTYLAGVDRSVGAWRTFRTDRMRGAELVGARRELGTESMPAGSHSGEVEPAIVPPGAEWFLDEYEFAYRTSQSDGSTRVGIFYHDRAWLERFLLGHADVIAPENSTMREHIAQRAREGLAAYEENS